MNTLSQIGKQISDLFASMTPSARIMAGLMAGVIVVSMGWILTGTQNSSQTYILGGRILSDDELKLAEEAFSNAGLREYEFVGQRIKVPTLEKDLYVKALSSGDALPEAWGTEFDRALSSSNPFESTELVSLRMAVAKERELARRLESIPGVERAAVEYDEARTGFGRETEKVCSIHIKGIGNRPLESSLMRSIADMAPTVFAGLSVKNVSVFDLGSSSFYRGSDDPLAPGENPYLQTQREYERKYEDQISRVLSVYGAYKLAVHVDLDPTMLQESEKLQYDPSSAVAVNSTSSRKDEENTKPLIGGRPGAEPNAFANEKATLANGNAQSSTTKQSEESLQRVAGHQATVTKVAGLVPTSVAVSIGIPDSYYRRVWTNQQISDNPEINSAEDIQNPPTPADLTAIKQKVEGNIRKAVDNLILVTREGDDRTPMVNVYDYPDLPPEPLPQPSLAENSLAWLQDSWSTLALLGVVGASLLMMFSWVRSQGDSAADKQFADGFGLEIPAIEDEVDISGENDLEETAEGKKKPAFELEDGELKDDLSSLVKGNPDVAVNLIKRWMSEAA